MLSKLPERRAERAGTARVGGLLSAAVLIVAAAACSSGRHGATRLTLHVDGPVTRTSSQRCLFRLHAPIREGGTQRTCLESIDGFPSPNATMRSRGVMTFSLSGGTISLRVRIRQRFGPDGAHARQTVQGAVVDGSGRFEGARGSISGGGTVVDTRESLRRPRLAYTVTLARG